MKQLVVFLFLFCAAIYSGFYFFAEYKSVATTDNINNPADETLVNQINSEFDNPSELDSINFPEFTDILTNNPELISNEYTQAYNGAASTIDSIKPPWKSVLVKKGDNLAKIFYRLNLSPQTLHEIISINEETKKLKHIKPDDEISFHIYGNSLIALEYDLSLTETLSINRIEDVYQAEIIKHELVKVVKEIHSIIDSSLFVSAQNAGLSDNLTMQLIALYGWDIDFALDIRKGDEFFLIYEEQYKNGHKVKDGPILAAEFVNQNKHLKAVRYDHADGHIEYYSETGHNMRKAFLRTPLNFTRISSHFNLRRKHPVLNKIRAHRGVDYAAPTGTAVKATGDGVVKFAGNKGGYGRTVNLKHGEKYSTLYAHLSKYAKGIKPGARVKQGQTIGYVGMTGLATGPHLHYEFRINGVHYNPLTIKLPKALKIPDSVMGDFLQQTKPLLTQLEQLTSNKIQLAESNNSKKSVVAMTDDSEINSPTQ